MKHLIHYSFLFASFCAVTPASALVDPAAAVVKVRKSCSENTVEISNCFTNMGALTLWMKDTRKPNATRPLRVDIGPGTFEEDVAINCNPTTNYTGYTTFEGSGSPQTTLSGFGSGGSSPITVRSCTELNFSHLKIITRFYGGVLWKGGGNSNWTDVEIIGNGRAWYEESCATSRGKHYWFGSKLSASAAFSIAETYRATCDESWFYGTEVNVSIPVDSYPASGGAMLASGNGIIHIYGSALRTSIDGPGSAAAAVVGLTGVGGEIHIHGTGIDFTSRTGRDVVALSALNGGVIHANQTAYNPQTSGAVTRILNNGGHIHAPYLWEHIPNPATIRSYTSADGADRSTVIINGYPHSVIYSTKCKIDTNNLSAWYDTVDKTCRGY